MRFSGEQYDMEVYFNGRRAESKQEYEKALFCYAYASAGSNNPIYSEAKYRVYAILAPKKRVTFTEDTTIPKIENTWWSIL